jgi:hypothetical protein
MWTNLLAMFLFYGLSRVFGVAVRTIANDADNAFASNVDAIATLRNPFGDEWILWYSVKRLNANDVKGRPPFLFLQAWFSRMVFPPFSNHLGSFI